jgi:hypothetical protein
MLKQKELSDPNSCWNKARPGERVFVLLERDAAAPVAIRAWVKERVRLGKNKMGDAQITEALECARLMESERVPIMHSVTVGADGAQTHAVVNMDLPTDWRKFHHDNVAKLDPLLRDHAVAWLRENMQFPEPLVERARADAEWWTAHHRYSMMNVRNELRSHGFGEREFGVDNLDDYAVGLVELAMGIMPEAAQ